MVTRNNASWLPLVVSSFPITLPAIITASRVASGARAYYAVSIIDTYSSIDYSHRKTWIARGLHETVSAILFTLRIHIE